MTRKELLQALAMADRPLTCEEIGTMARLADPRAASVRQAVKRASDDGAIIYIGMRHRRYYLKGLLPRLITVEEEEMLETERRLAYLLYKTGGEV
jgi:hypothetical protein